MNGADRMNRWVGVVSDYEHARWIEVLVVGMFDRRIPGCNAFVWRAV